MQTYYEDPTRIRDVLFAHDPEAERRMAAKDEEEIEAILNWGVGTGRIQTPDSRFKWGKWLALDRDVARESLEAVPEDREFGDVAAGRDPNLLRLAREWNDYCDIEEPVRAYSDFDSKTDAEKLYDRLAEATNEAHIVARAER